MLMIDMKKKRKRYDDDESVVEKGGMKREYNTCYRKPQMIAMLKPVHSSRRFASQCVVLGREILSLL